MEAKDLLQHLRERISGLNPQTLVISVAWLQNELSALDQKSGELSEQQKLTYAMQLENHKAFHAGANESFKAALDYAKVALTTSFLSNGGSAIAMLAFLGHLKPVGNAGLYWGVVIFAFGALSAAAAIGCAFLAQEKVTQSTWMPQLPSVPHWRIASIRLTVFSYAMFFVGVAYTAYRLAQPQGAISLRLVLIRAKRTSPFRVNWYQFGCNKIAPYAQNDVT